jgi:hypothetical protein
MYVHTETRCEAVAGASIEPQFSGWFPSVALPLLSSTSLQLSTRFVEETP